MRIKISQIRAYSIVAGLLFFPPCGFAQSDPVAVLNLPEAGTSPGAIDYAALPTLKGQQAIVRQKFHVIEHDGHVLIALSRGKVQIEVFRVRLDDIDAMLRK
jgi:hypothetical protein